MITFRIRVCLLGWLVLLVLCAAPAGATKYVDCGVASEGGGTSWGDAFKTISNAVAQVTNGEEIWVAQGLYTNWALATGMAVGNHTLLGGYPTGGGTRDWVANPTILDGLSAKRVFNKTGAGVFTLDGFTVQNGLDTAVGVGGGGGALVCTAGSLTIRNCFFTNNVITTDTGGGGAIRTDVAAVENIFSNCTFTANTAPGSGAYGGAFFARFSSTNSFVSCTFVTNRATSSGGAVSAYESAGFTQVRDCVFSNNVSSGNGGAIYSPSPLVVSGGTNVFCGNYASGGGAILGRTVSVYNSLFTNNVSGGSGAIRTDSGSDCLISNCTFTANEGGGYGAAVYMAGANTYTFDACTFETNRASGAGGGAISLNVAGGLLKVKNCTFANNVCSGGNGGAIQSLSPLEIFGSTNVIRGSVASSGGGAIYSTAALTIRNVSFTTNTSVSHGGVIYATVAGAENLFSNCAFTANASSGGWGGALYMNGASTSTFDACTFVTNRSGGAGNGGAVCLNKVGGLLQVRNSAFTNNVCPGGAGGGAIYSVSPLGFSGSNNVFYGNVASVGDGGAVFGSAANAANSFSNCTFTANAVGGAHLGGAVYLSGASSTNTLMNCAFVANTATSASGRGGGVYFVGNSAENRVRNCTFFTNASALQGGALWLGGTTPTLGITNSIFWMDVSASGGEIYRNAGTIAIAYTSLDTNKIFASSAPTYGSGITNVNPLFASETAPYDVHLKSTAGRWLNGGWVVDDVKSPCIDAGDTNSPYALEPEGNGRRINLGAYGNTLFASLSSPRSGGTVFKFR
jgi:predicted outer membrane repeat protein